MKANEIRKTEALKLRENGMKLNDIVAKVSLSKATLKRLFKKKGLTNNKLSLSHKPPVNSDLPVIGDTKDPESEPITEKVKLNSEPKGVSDPSFHNTHVTFDTKTGGFTLEPVEKKTIEPETNQTIIPKAEVVAGGGQQYQTSHITEKREIDEPENVMDKFFTRGMIETLVPVGLLLAGYMISGKKGMKGEFREDRGDSW
jgi:hypothetical protein